MDIVEEIASKAEGIKLKLMQNHTLNCYIDKHRRIPAVFMKTNMPRDIKLIVIGQDPTVRNEHSRDSITTTLNLDKGGTLRDYLKSICTVLGLELDSNVYATNLAKNFFTRPPTIILKEDNRDVLRESSVYWIPLIKYELSLFPSAVVIILGEPLLRTLVADKAKALVRIYWGYTKDWRQPPMKQQYSLVSAEENILGRSFFPFPHQPSLRQPFYKTTFDCYLRFVKSHSPHLPCVQKPL